MTHSLQTGVFLDLETVDNGDLDRGRLSQSLPRWEWHPFSMAEQLSLIHISEPTRLNSTSRMPSSA